MFHGGVAMSSIGFFFWTVLLAQAFGLPPQVPGPFEVGQDTAEASATVQGVVTRVGSGVPIGRAVVSLQPVTNPNDPTAILNALGNRSQIPSSTSDAGGNFIIEGIAPGEYRILVSRNGFVRQQYGESGAATPGTPVELIADQAFEASFELVPAGTITGRIYDEFGEPVPYVSVAAMQPRVRPDGQEAFATVQADTTNDRGEYRLFWLTPGEYFISASTSGSGIGPISMGGNAVGGSIRILSSSSSIGGPPVEEMAAFYPGVPDAALATPVRVGAGDELAGIDVRLASKATYTISGRVIGPSQISGFALVTIRPSNGAALGGVRFSFNANPVDAQGNFTIQNVAPGAYTLQVRADVIGGEQARAALEVEVTNRDLENMTLTLTPGIDVSGSVFIEDATTAAASETVSGLDMTQVGVMLRGEAALGAAASQPSDTQGSFLIEYILPGEYTVNLNALNRGLYLKRIMVGNLEVAPGDTIAIPPDFNQQIYVLVSPNGGRIDGVASNRSGEPMPNATITLLPLDMPQTAPGDLAPGLSKQTRTGTDGEFSLAGIRPGEYRLFAWEGTQSVPYLNAEFMGRFQARGERLSIQEGDGLNLNLDVIPESETR